ncbi:MAG: hypothetical protein AAFR64_07100 [Pseudomonadota bacterium]
MRFSSPLIALFASLAVSGCAARTAVNVVTAPVKVASSAVDAVTTSQSEADENRGREIRKREEELEKLEKKYEKELKRCREGDRRNCDKAKLIQADIEELKKEMYPPRDDELEGAEAED